MEEETATHSSTLAWRVSGTEEPGGLSSMGSHRRTRLKQLSSSGSSRDDIGNLIIDKSKQHFAEWI